MDSEQDSLHSAAINGDNAVLVATTLATLVLAGSALICRSGRRLRFPAFSQPVDDSPEKDAVDASVTDPAERPKNAARSKERRRRGKDPLKEVLKGGKKLKMLAVLPRDRNESASASTSASVSPLLPPHMQHDSASSSQRSASVSTSGRSGSRVSATAPVAADDQSTPEAAITQVPEISVSDSSSSSTVHLQRASSSSSSTKQSDPWEWDGQGPSPAPQPAKSARKSPAPIPLSTETDSPQQVSDEISLPSLNPAAVSRPATPRKRRTPTPSAGTPPPSLSTQTQLASLRGALEAARMREEKVRAELDSLSKDAEMMRWENSTWRRRELELQGQIHHLMHQLQAYAAFFAAQAHMQHVPPGGGSPGPSSPPYPSPVMFSPGMLSPVTANGQPFFAYPAPGHPPSHPPPPPPPQQQQQQTNLFEMLFPTPPNSNGSVSGGSSADSGSGSGSGAGSPDLVGSPLPLDRGRRRTRTHTAEARLGPGSGWDDGWVGIEVPPDLDAEEAVTQERREDEGEEEDDDGTFGVSGVLADAILKRPESIRVRSRKGRRKDVSESETEVTEFTFPSLTDFGVGAGYRNAASPSPSAATTAEVVEQPGQQVQEQAQDMNEQSLDSTHES
ncbi:hypothetical protein FB45DRAFT_1003131 [Roridomyces roridus]|uniref:Uncharacterized protein n=1 Tax=Roridomyces roridus TaxID=1738132 RepID=A0AAD7FML9_9AGAR|nr:hypothetical protein FB45DRAFT_1003131 [Roridomyces roridus]